MLTSVPAAPAGVYQARAAAGAQAPAASPPRSFYTAPPEAAKPAAASQAEIDWQPMINQLSQMADSALQNRSKKVKEMLASTDHNLDALERTIDRISQTSIMFVDPARLTNLANDMRQLVEEQR